MGGRSHAATPGLILIPRFIRVIPEAIWVALALCVAAAAGGAFAAVMLGRRARRQASHIAQVTAVALTDPLTNALNRRGFTEAVERELDRARRYERTLVLAYGDVRGLKAVNDGEGHLAGDELLKAVAGTLEASSRPHDVIGRLGGDEFGVLLPEQTADDAAVVTTRIRKRLHSTRERLGFQAQWDLTIGTAVFPDDGVTAEALIAVADRRLYEQRGIALANAR